MGRPRRRDQAIRLTIMMIRKHADPAAWCGPPDPESPRRLLTPFVALILLLHLPSFAVPHRGGDELAYLAVAASMDWDLSNYTTREHPVVSHFPYSIYRQELFHQPPLYPLILKVGHAAGAPVAIGLMAQLLLMVMLLFFSRRVAAIFKLPQGLQVALYSAITFGPLLLFSTTRLHHEGLLAGLLFCALAVYLEADRDQSVKKVVMAAFLLVLALNVRYNAIVALPLLPALLAYQMYRNRQTTMPPAQWASIALVVLLDITLGLPHYYRVFATYGSLMPSAFIVPDLDVEQFNTYLRDVHTRTRVHVSVALVVLFPMILTWFTPSYARYLSQRFHERSWELAFPVATVFLLTVHMVLLHSQLRYFAVATPFMFMSFVLQLNAAEGARRRRLWGWAGLTLLSMGTSAVSAAVLRPDIGDVYPSAFALLIFLAERLP